MRSNSAPPGPGARPPAASRCALVLVAVSLAGCVGIEKAVIAPHYQRAELDPARGEALLDLPYLDGAGTHPEKHRLDLFRPRGPGWPTLVFVHGGSLENGDKALRRGGYDLYRNIGRFYASRGVAVALVNYRLQPEVRWPQQADDVAAATRWVLDNVESMGGDGRVFLAGHSAGAWLAAHAVLDQDRAARYDLHPEEIAGIISVSGSGYDLTDRDTWEMFGREKVWARRFEDGESGEDWRTRASVVPLVDKAAPPFLLVYTKKEWEALARQNRLLRAALEDAGVEARLVELETGSHRRMVLALSRGDGRLSATVLDFVAGPPAAPAGAASGPE
ncbi:MAG: alpha/beta hydrolase [Thermoanaerobaculia bacterium]|nr:alpha/beta hydrolase [Thermoanaerobaculia bacterium]